MRILLTLAVLSLALSGCQPKSTPATQSAPPPKLIEQLTDQVLVYSCPKCGMDFETNGQCTMCNVDLVATDIAYICPEDNQPVPAAGPCPRCGMQAKVVKTAAGGPTPAPTAPPGG
jgi:predicted RNA-binding Zn-ribbon protein involved in translation (DUF1610 family)